jgi:hypothetical protein
MANQMLSLKVGDTVIISKRPPQYTSASGNNGLDNVNYPYKAKVTRVRNKQSTSIRFTCDRGFGWVYHEGYAMEILNGVYYHKYKYTSCSLPKGVEQICNSTQMNQVVKEFKELGLTKEDLSDYIKSTGRISHQFYKMLRGNGRDEKSNILWGEPEISEPFKVGDYVVSPNGGYTSSGQVMKVLEVKKDLLRVKACGHWNICDSQLATPTEILASKYADEYNSINNGNNPTNLKPSTNGLQSKIKADGRTKRGVSVRLRRSTSKVTNGVRPIGNHARVSHRKAKFRSGQIRSSTFGSGGIRCTS